MTPRRVLTRAGIAAMTFGAVVVMCAAPATAAGQKGTATRTAHAVFNTGDRFGSVLTIDATQSTTTTSSAVTTNTATVRLQQTFCDTSGGGFAYLAQVDVSKTVTNGKGVSMQVLPSGNQSATVDIDSPNITLTGTITNTPMDLYSNCEVQEGPSQTSSYSVLADIESQWAKASTTPTSSGAGTDTFTWSNSATTTDLDLDIKSESLDDDFDGAAANAITSNASFSLTSHTTDGSNAATLYPIKP